MRNTATSQNIFSLMLTVCMLSACFLDDGQYKSALHEAIHDVMVF